MSEITNRATTSGAGPAGMPAPPPREVTAAAKRRSWGEPRVRTWWVLAMAMLAISIYFTARQFVAGSADRALIEKGQVVDAVIVSANGTRLPGKQFAPDDRAELELKFTPPDGSEMIVLGRLQAQKEHITPGQTIQIRIDPRNPRRWTDRTQPASRLEQFTVLLMLLPAVLVLGAVALVKRRRVLTTWRTAPAAVAVVVEKKQSAAAPLSRILRFTLREGQDRRVVATLVPTAKASQIEPGREIWVVAEPDEPERAVVAALYE